MPVVGGISISFIAIAIFALRVHPNFTWLMKATDSIGLALLAVALLPWLGLFLKKWEISGLGSAEYREISKKIDQAKSTASEAVDAAYHAEDLFLNAAHAEVATPHQVKGKGALEILAKNYIATRESMKSGNLRTAEMTRIFREMMNEARKLGDQGFDLSGSLRSPDAGNNIAAIAYTYVFPDRVNPGDLLWAIKNTAQPFVQYWGLRSLNNIVDRLGITPFSMSNIEEIIGLQSKIKKNTDRQRTLDHLIDRIERLLSERT